MPSKPTVTIQTVTPKQAAEWLVKANIGNRNVRPSVVQFYAQQMAAGLWLMNGDALRFDDEGVLQDGQHRLAACVKSDTSFRTVVIEGLPDSIRATIDVGTKRTSSDFLTYLGYHNASQLAAAARLAYLYDIGKPFTPDAVANQVLANWLEENDDIANHAAIGQRIYRALRWSAPMWTAMCYLLAQVDADRAADFMGRIETGANLPRFDPALTLRDYVIKQKENSSRGSNPLPARYQMAYVIKAWNADYKSQQLKLMRWTAAEGYPQIAGYPNP